MMHTSILSLVILVLICRSHSQFAGIRESFDGIRESFDGIREYFERWERLTVKGTRCIFPFVNGGVPFSNCARGVEQPFAWCATEVTDDNQWKDWEVCFPDPSDFLSPEDFEQPIGDFLSPADFEQPIGDFLSPADFEQPIVAEIDPMIIDDPNPMPAGKWHTRPQYTQYRPQPPIYKNHEQVDDQYQSSEYHFSWLHGNQYYSGGTAYCRGLNGGWLPISIETYGENNFVTGVIQRYKLPYIWTGAFRTRNGFRWPSGGYFRGLAWAHTGQDGVPQPDGLRLNRVENCIAVINNAFNDGVKWHDVACHHKKPTICERRKANW